MSSTFRFPTGDEPDAALTSSFTYTAAVVIGSDDGDENPSNRSYHIPSRAGDWSYAAPLPHQIACPLLSGNGKLCRYQVTGQAHSDGSERFLLAWPARSHSHSCAVSAAGACSLTGSPVLADMSIYVHLRRFVRLCGLARYACALRKSFSAAA